MKGKKKRIKRLAVLLCLILLVQSPGIYVHAAEGGAGETDAHVAEGEAGETDVYVEEGEAGEDDVHVEEGETGETGLCEHHPVHDEACGYVEAIEEQPCGHVHDETCGCREAAEEVPCDMGCTAPADAIVHAEGCAYRSAVEEQPCGHVHDEECGYAEAVEEIPCDMDCSVSEEDGTIVHAEGCAYRPAVEEQPCGHVHNEECGYAEAVEEIPCDMGCTALAEAIVHAEGCAYRPAVEEQPCGHIHDEECGYVEGREGQPCTYVCEICNAAEEGIKPAATGSSFETTVLSDISSIDLADAEDGAIAFTYKIGIKNSLQWDTLGLEELQRNRSVPDEAEKFTVEIPASVFDDKLTVDWDNVAMDTGGDMTPYMKVQEADGGNGIVLCGDSTESLSKDSAILVSVPVKLEAEQFDAAKAAGEIRIATGEESAIVSAYNENTYTWTIDQNGNNSVSIPVIDSRAAGLTVTTAEGAPVAIGSDGSWTFDSGSYILTGDTQEQPVRIIGDVTLTLRDVNIDRTGQETMAGISIEQGNVNMILEGNNVLTGSPGFAGIYVDRSASLTVFGEGTLTATGGDGSERLNIKLPAFMQSGSNKNGYWGGGAGIGGNGAWIYSATDQWIDGYTPHCGSIIIRGGNISARGGGARNGNAGAGAGIGAGGSGIKCNFMVTPAFEGTVEICDGIVNATGGEGEENSLTLGGAGIGSGGVGGNLYAQNNRMTVSISGGNVTATGTADGAGIGGGANADGGSVRISGGIVNATGGYEIDGGSQYGAYGGAGIGGGDMGGVTEITITGNAKVTARAFGAAAGIGGGQDAPVGTFEISEVDSQNVYGKNQKGTITIAGSADVTAIGGSHPRMTFGGAGIGAGRSYYYDNGCGSISILENAKVRAYAGARAQAVGVGSDYGGADQNTFHVGAGTIDVWMFNQDTDAGAFWGQNEDGSGLTGDFSSDGASAVWYTMPEDENFPAADALVSAYGASGTGIYSWKHTADAKVQILQDGQILTEESYPAGTGLGNWGTFYNKSQISVSYEWISTDNPKDVSVPADDVFDAGTAYSAKAQEPTGETYTFYGWYTDKECSVPYEDGTVLNASIVLYGKWVKDSQPEPEKTGNLVVTKKVTGKDGELSKAFHFTVTLDDTSLNGTYGDMTFKDGEASFTLKHGENKKATGLPAGITYKATEAEADRNGYVTTVTGAEGTIREDVTVKAAFINKKAAPVEPDKGTGSLTISKVVNGTAGEKDREFVFTVSLQDAGGKELGQKFSYEGSKAGAIRSGGTVTLKHGESVTIRDLPEGTQYLVTEQVPEGYTSTVTGEKGSIVAKRTKTAAFVNTKEQPVSPEQPKDPADQPDQPGHSQTSTPSGQAGQTANIAEPAEVAQTPEPIGNTPLTGDNARWFLWIGLLGISLLVLSVTLKGNHKRNDRR